MAHWGGWGWGGVGVFSRQKKTKSVILTLFLLVIT